MTHVRTTRLLYLLGAFSLTAAIINGTSPSGVAPATAGVAPTARLVAFDGEVPAGDSPRIWLVDENGTNLRRRTPTMRPMS